jgi:uncharacterized protein YprB with RNaseH-like and TPR domain
MIDTLVLDIETTHLSADLGVVLCMSYESSREPGEVVTLRNDVINAKDWKKGQRGNDRELVKQANAVIRSHDLHVAHYGKRFDLPFLRTRAMMQGLTPLPEMVVIDPWAIARNKFKFNSNRLDTIAKALGSVHQKTPLDLQVWRSAALDGDADAMDAIVEHCEADVHVLSFVLDQVKPFIRQYNERGSDL